MYKVQFDTSVGCIFKNPSLVVNLLSLMCMFACFRVMFSASLFFIIRVVLFYRIKYKNKSVKDSDVLFHSNPVLLFVFY